MTKIITENFKVENTNELYGSFIGTDSLVTSGFDGALQSKSNEFNSSDPAQLNSALTLDEQIAIKKLLDAQIKIHGSSAEYYIMASSYSVDPTINNSQFAKREFQRRVIFGNKVPVDDVRYMFDAPLWIAGTVYDDFDDTEDTSTKNLFVHIVDGSQVTHVFKCLENNNDSMSLQAPSLTLDASGNTFIHVISGDGYVWHYMFSITENERKVFSTADTLPFPAPGNTDVIARAKEDISQIKIIDTQSNLFAKCVFGLPAGSTTGNTANASNVTILGTGKIQEPVDGGSGNRLITVKINTLDSEFLDDAENSYTNMYLWSSSSLDPLYEVLKSNIVVGDRTSMTIEIDAEFFDIAGKYFKLVPKIKISQSDGTQALAYGIIDRDGTLVKIGYKNRGSGYKYATATLEIPKTVGNLFDPSESGATLRCVIAPTGGHGSNPINEMAMSKLTVITNFSGTSTTVPDTGTYTKVGLLKNPSFLSPSTGALLENGVENPAEGFDNRLRLTIQANSVDADYTDSLTAGQTISQESSTGETVTAIIHEVKYDADTGKTYIYLVDYIGAFTSKFITGPVGIDGAAGKNINTSDAIYGNYSAYSGEVLHFLDFDPITRILDRKEKIKFTFDF